MAKITEHVNVDWCHLCGQRKRSCVDVRYSNNAEHDPHSLDKYIRICAECAGEISLMGLSQELDWYEGVRVM